MEFRSYHNAASNTVEDSFQSSIQFRNMDIFSYGNASRLFKMARIFCSPDENTKIATADSSTLLALFAALQDGHSACREASDLFQNHYHNASQL
jgi:hypothetical protein